MKPPERALRAWRLKSRWIAASVLLLLLSYPFALGPLAYAREREWVSRIVADAFTPVWLKGRAREGDPSLLAFAKRYRRWWGFRGPADRLQDDLESETNLRRRQALREAVEEVESEAQAIW